MVDEAVKAMAERLVKSAASTLELALARYDTAAKQEILAYARELLRSEDPGERTLGQQLEAEVLREASRPAPLVLEVAEVDGPRGIAGAIDPLSQRSSQASPDVATPSAVSGNGEVPKRGPGRPKKSQSNGQPDPTRRGPGRPRKA